MRTLIFLLIAFPVIAFSRTTLFQVTSCLKITNTAGVLHPAAQVDFVEMYLDSANSLRQQGRFEDALHLYQKVIEIQPANDQAYIGCMGMNFELGRVEEGLKVIDQWIEQNPDNSQAWLYKAFAEAETGHSETSLTAFDNLIRLKPEEASYQIGRGQMLYELKRFDEALEAFGKALDIDPSRADVWGMKASTLSKLGRFDEAFVSIGKAIEIFPDDPTNIYNRACIYSLKGDKANALADLKKAIGLEASFKEYARTDADFTDLYDDEEFKNLTK